MIGGKTPSEQYLAKLCQRSFLSLWSFPNVFTDRGKEKTGIGQELCDLLVVFGNDVIIFSDKSCEYKNTNRLQVDWNRWYNKAIGKSCEQIFGAERWIRLFSDRIFLDASCNVPFPITLPPSDSIRIHRIAVALGAKDACRSFYGSGSGSGSGSLRLNTDLSPIMADDSEGERLKAFTVGHFDRTKGYVHVFDDVTLDIVLGELDTISDFCIYLRKKEQLIQSATVSSSGEEDILAFYLTTMDADGQHGFGLGEHQYTSITIEDKWNHIKINKIYMHKKKLDQGSYIWDDLIEHFNKQRKDGDLVTSREMHDYEPVARKLASLNRFERRIVGNKLIAVLKETAPNQERFSAILPKMDGDRAYIFVLLPPYEEFDYEEYRKFRLALLTAYAGVIKLKCPQVLEVIGIATEPEMAGRGRTEDLVISDFSVWTEEQAQQAKQDMDMLDLGAAPVGSQELEYPYQERAPRVPKREEQRRLRQLARQRAKAQ